LPTDSNASFGDDRNRQRLCWTCRPAVPGTIWLENTGETRRGLHRQRRRREVASMLAPSSGSRRSVATMVRPDVLSRGTCLRGKVAPAVVDTGEGQSRCKTSALLGLLPRIILRVDVGESPRTDGGDLYNRLIADEDIMRRARRKGEETAGGQGLGTALIG